MASLDLNINLSFSLGFGYYIKDIGIK